MENNTELRKVVYSLLLTQIKFGVYRYGEKLPTIEETSDQLCVSIDTARAAYLQLKRDGYITLSKNIGATVKVNYDGQEIAQFVQTFFSTRKNAMLDLANSLWPLLGNIQGIGLKHASSETMRKMEQLYQNENIEAPYAMLKHLNQKYSPLGNTLLMRLVWQTFMFLFDPFFSIEENLLYFDKSNNYISTILKLYQEKDWAALRVMVENSMERLALALDRFYTTKITAAPSEEITFAWSSYRKSGQLCYSLAMELLISINRGIYPVGSLLPSQEALAAQKGVSVSTVRRALGLLSSVGAIESERYVGTCVLPFDKTTDRIDFTNPVLHRQLLDMTESLQILAFSCRAVCELTLSSLDAGSLQQLCRELKTHRKRQRYEILDYVALDLLAKYAPYQTIRTVYAQLLQQFFWASSLRGMKGDQETINATYGPYFDDLIDSLEHAEFSRFAVRLEELITYEFREAVGCLTRLGIPGAKAILLPSENEIHFKSGEAP